MTIHGVRSSFPADYAVFQVDGDETWYAGWMERNDDETPRQFHLITRVDGGPVRFASQEEAERECGYHYMASMYPDSHWLAEVQTADE